MAADTYSAEKLYLLGPIPVSGATVSNLEATTDTALTGTNSYTVDVIDNTTGSAVLSCTINATTSFSTTTCRSTGSATVTAGHYLEVKITKSSGAPPDAAWRVSFRY